jgi:hypothetical protein
VNYLLRRERKAIAVAELESLDRAQMYTFKCQYRDRDNGEARLLLGDRRSPGDASGGTASRLLPVRSGVARLSREARTRFGDTSDEYYEVSRADRQTIYGSPYKFYDHRIKACCMRCS